MYIRRQKVHTQKTKTLEKDKKTAETDGEMYHVLKLEKSIL